MNANELITRLGEKLGFEISLSAEGTCIITFGEEEIGFEETSTDLFFIATIGNVNDNITVLKRFLRANFLGNETGGAYISIDNENFMLHRQISLPRDYQDFEVVLSNFVVTLRYWKEWLNLPQEENNQEIPENLFFNEGMMRV